MHFKFLYSITWPILQISDGNFFSVLGQHVCFECVKAIKYTSMFSWAIKNPLCTLFGLFDLFCLHVCAYYDLVFSVWLIYILVELSLTFMCFIVPYS